MGRQDCNFPSSIRRAGLTVVGLLTCLALTTNLRSDEDPPASKDTKLHQKLRELHTKDATEYQIYRDTDRKEKLELREEAVYLWTNVLREQTGSVYVWTWHGRPEVIGSIFSASSDGQRRIFHEFHSLSQATLIPDRLSANTWQPKTGLQRKQLPGAPKPAETPRQRMFQMRELSKEFTAHSIDYQDRTWELRLLTQPLYRYESTDPDLIDGALFSFVTSAGTDPEVVIVLEAQRTDDGPVWNYAVCRFSDHKLHVEHKQIEIWTSKRGDNDEWGHDAKHLYRIYGDRTIKELVVDPDTP